MRSSSYGTWSFCPFQYYLSYVLCLKPNKENKWITPKPQKKADKGNIVHKALELLADKKFSSQENKLTFSNEELNKTWNVEPFTIQDAIQESWEYYTRTKNTPFTWDMSDHHDVVKWTNDALTYSNGIFNPLKREVIWPEKRFDFVIEEPWAKFNYDFNGEKIEGYLGIKGTIDLTVKVNEFEDTIELIDWKTGLRKDWVTGKKKDWKSLRKDPQLMLYYLALSYLFPKIKNIIISIVWIQDGGAYSLDYGREDIDKTKEMLRKRFDEIKNCERPKRIITSAYHNWKCQRLCQYGPMNKYPNSEQSPCDYMHNELITLGIDKVTKKYANIESITQYADGGGRSGGK